MATVAAGVSKRYGRRRPWVLDRIDLRLEAATLTAVVGANGSGKSTLLRVLAGISRPTAGTVLARPARVGYVPERLPSRLRMTSRTYLGHMARLQRLEPARAAARIDELARRLGVQPGLDAPIGVLSKGNNQKVALAQALLAPVELLLLDEPWNGLDPVAARALHRELTEARRQGTAVLATAHRAGSVPFPDQELVLSGGHLAPVTSATVTSEAPQTVVVELLPPRHAAHRRAPEWAGTRDVEQAGELWRASVRAGAVDELLARAIHDGWSVHRVDPGPAYGPPSSGPQSNEAQSSGLE